MKMVEYEASWPQAGIWKQNFKEHHGVDDDKDVGIYFSVMKLETIHDMEVDKAFNTWDCGCRCIFPLESQLSFQGTCDNYRDDDYE